MRCPSCQETIPEQGCTVGRLVGCPACQAQFSVDMAPDATGLPQLSFSRLGKPAGEELGPAVRERFTVGGVLGRGGQGAVWRVRPRGAARDYALKYVDVTSDEPSDVFNREEELTSLLAHPSIVQAYAAGRDGDRAYAVYEIVEGRTLSDLIAEGPLQIAQGVDIALQAFAGLAHSHVVGIVHRDIKPANILITHDGRAKIADFGIGRLVGPNARLGAEYSMTFMGTPGYAPPEQIKGRGVIPASDVYAMAMTLYKCLTGRIAYGAETLELLMLAQCTQAADDVREHRLEVPPGIAAFLAECLDRSPSKRPATGAIALERLRDEALAAGFPVPLALERCPPERLALLSRAGLAAAGTRLAASLAALALPLAALALASGAPGTLARLTPMVVMWLVWLPLLAALTYRAGQDVADDGLAAREWGLFPELAHPGAEKLVGLALLPVAASAVRLAGGAALAYVAPFVLVCHALAAVLLFARTAEAWIEHGLTPTARGEHGVLELAGPPGARARLDDGPETRLPARLLVGRGAHRLAILTGKTAREFRFATSEPARHAVRFFAASDGVVPVKAAARATAPHASLMPPLLALAAAAGLGAALVLYPLGARILAPPAASDAPGDPPPPGLESVRVAPDEPDDARARELLATAQKLRRQHWTPRAVAACRESLALAPSFSAQVLLVRCLAESGQARQAWAELERARRVAGEADARKKTLEDLAREISEKERP